MPISSICGKPYGIIAPPVARKNPPGDVLELADRHDLGSCAARRVGSTPTIPTTFRRYGRISRGNPPPEDAAPENQLPAMT